MNIEIELLGFSFIVLKPEKDYDCNLDKTH